MEGRIAEERHEQLRTYLTADLAALKIRLGDPVSAIPLLERLHAGAVAMGDDMLRADIELGLAEAAAARGDWDAASRYLTQSRARLSPDIYTSHRRIDVLDVAALRAQGRLDEARLKADRLRSEAQRNGDAVLLAEVDAAFSAEVDMARR